MPHTSSSTCNTPRVSECPPRLAQCVVCPPDAPDSQPCIKDIKISVKTLADDIRVQVNGVSILDRRYSPGPSFFLRTFPGHLFKLDDVITLDVYTKGATYTVGSWDAIVTYIRGERETESTFRATLDSTPIPTPSGEEYINFATFTLE